jgi:predicted hotdog family 3-hydroxylacyl-ACP dehydratase
MQTLMVCVPAVTASMLSRSGMMCFLYTCFSSVDKHIRVSILVCMAIQVVVNSVTAVQIIVQCGPNPYHAVCDFPLPENPIPEGS